MVIISELLPLHPPSLSLALLFIRTSVRCSCRRCLRHPHRHLVLPSRHPPSPHPPETPSPQPRLHLQTRVDQYCDSNNVQGTISGCVITGAPRLSLSPRAGELHAMRVHTPTHAECGVTLARSVPTARIAGRHVRARRRSGVSPRQRRARPRGSGQASAPGPTRQRPRTTRRQERPETTLALVVT